METGSFGDNGDIGSATTGGSGQSVASIGEFIPPAGFTIGYDESTAGESQEVADTYDTVSDQDTPQISSEPGRADVFRSIPVLANIIYLDAGLHDDPDWMEEYIRRSRLRAA